MAGVDLEARTRALESAIAAGDGRLPADLVHRGRDVVAHVRERAALSAEHTVVAVAGATGSGKSSLVNALAGAHVSEPGVRRPTTATARAAVRGPGADRLLDWLEVRDRVEIGAGDRGDGAGLVLLDLPDHDSVVTEHRLRAERLVSRADLIVWVVDPQKYADAVLHERYLRGLTAHAEVMVLVLNHADRLAPEEVEPVRQDLARLAAADGLGAVPVLALSARTGAGVDALAALVDAAVRQRQAAVARLVADVRTVAAELVGACGDTPRAAGGTGVRDTLVRGLEAAAGVDAVAEAVRASAVLDARAATGWPVTRWLARWRPDPLRRIGLRSETSRPDLARTSLPVPRATATAASRRAVRETVDAATASMPLGWAEAARRRVERSVDSLPDALDQAVAGTSLGAAARPWWWGVVNALQWVVLVVGGAGLLWLGMLAVAGYFRLPELPVPEWGGWPVPTVLALGALVLGLLLALVSRFLAGIGARHRERQVRARLRTAIGGVADEFVRLPLGEEQAELARCRTSAVIAAEPAG
ncbi:hypothetical protein GCM10025865_00520 [Paraoerskovia sediminicola]|uniref:AAA+ ATPase domain-containing protein n=1 Tax=Paraoerskovia sediminicola TaxID=1138587 RepID=A0ABM8FYD2_9CELL|nr:GTPase [Paraoerskovia sediminicola]BDZ40753.1 hypothetical protein GCM10025865_00520 [Paraoerskovia sediminicola]